MIKKQFVARTNATKEDGTPMVFDVETFDEVLELDWVKRVRSRPDFYGYCISDNFSVHGPSLMALYKWNEDFNGCEEWWVLGRLQGFRGFQTGLKEYHHFIRNHKPTCWTRKYRGNSEYFDINRPKEIQLKVAKELGWTGPDSLFGVAVHCDCGYDDKFNN